MESCWQHDDVDGGRRMSLVESSAPGGRTLVGVLFRGNVIMRES